VFGWAFIVWQCLVTLIQLRIAVLPQVLKLRLDGGFEWQILVIKIPLAMSALERPVAKVDRRLTD